MALKTHQCCGDASLPEQRSASRTMHTLNPPKIHLLTGGVVTHLFNVLAQSIRRHVGC
jgi:hypothetical protein